MTKNEALNKVEEILEEAKVGILATTGNDGRPHMRWMTPAIVRGRSNVIFTVTAPHFPKVIDLEAHPDVEWMIQTPALDKIVNLKGKMNILDNPTIKAEILEDIGNRLSMFWKVNEKMEFLVLETVIEEVTYFCPMKGNKETVIF